MQDYLLPKFRVVQGRVLEFDHLCNGNSAGLTQVSNTVGDMRGLFLEIPLKYCACIAYTGILQCFHISICNLKESFMDILLIIK